MTFLGRNCVHVSVRLKLYPSPHEPKRAPEFLGQYAAVVEHNVMSNVSIVFATADSPHGLVGCDPWSRWNKRIFQPASFYTCK